MMVYNPSSPTNDTGAIVTDNPQGGKNIILSPITTTSKQEKERYTGRSSKTNIPTRAILGASSTETVYTTEQVGSQGSKQMGISIAPDVAKKQNETFNIQASKQMSYDPNVFRGRERFEQAGKQPIILKEQEQSFSRKALTNIGLAQESATAEMQLIKQKYPEGTRASAKDIGLYYKASATSFGLGVVEGVTTPFIYPKETLAGLKSTFTNPVKTFGEMKSSFNVNPSRFLGQLYGQGAVLKVVGLGGQSVRGGFIKVTSKDVPATKFLDPSTALKVESGQKAFPLTSSVKQSVNEFSLGTTERGTVKVLTASDAPLSSFGQSRIVKIREQVPIAKSDRSLGTYVAPMGRGSPYFFKIEPSSSYSFSLLPKFKGRPTLTVGEVSGVSRIPSKVLEQGALAENIYLRSAPKGYAYISGNVEARFNPKFDVGGRFKTSESEAVINVGSVGKNVGGLTGYRESFKFGGRRIAVRELDFTADVSKSKAFSFENTFVKRGKTRISEGSYSYYEPSSNISLFRGIGYSSSRSFSSSGLKSSGNSFISGSSFRYPSSSSFFVGSSSSGVSSSSRINYGSSIYGRSSFSSSSYSPPTSSSYGLSSFGSSNVFKPSKTFFNIGKLKGEDKVSKFKGFPSRKVTKYTPSVEAAVLNIKGKASKFSVQSGLGLRPLVR